MAPLVQRLGFIALNAVDLDAVVADATAIAGARLVERTKDRAILTSNKRRAELVFYRASANEGRRIGLEAVHPDAVGEARKRAEKAGVTIVSDRPSLEFIDKSVTFVTSEGHVIEFHSAVPNDQPRWYAGPGIHPNCIDHVNLTAINPQAVTRELSDVLGTKLSERTVHDEVTWIRAADRRHHTIGIVRGQRPGMHHYSWEFNSFDDFKRLGDVLAAEERTLVWGPGRHGAGDNVFSYYLDPAGFMVECTAEMEIMHDDDVEPRICDAGAALDNPRVVNLWGSPPTKVWLEHHTDFAALDPADRGIASARPKSA